MTTDQIQIVVFQAAIAESMLFVLLAVGRDSANGVKAGSDGLALVLIAGGLCGTAAAVACMLVTALLRK